MGTNGSEWTVSKVVMYAPMYQLIWKTSDLTTATNSISPATSTPSSSPTQSTSTTSLPTQAPSRGLSTGAKAGIGVGVTVAALMAIGALLLFIRGHRRAKLQLQPYSGPPPPDALAPELHGREKFEMPEGQEGRRQANELSS